MSTNFFDFREQMTAKRVEPERRGPDGSVKPMTVSELTGMIDGVLRAGLPGRVFVQGEISNFTHHRGSGHFYFTMKDARACIDCVMFRSDAARIKFTPHDGMELIAGGEIQVYPAKGRYQFYARTLQPVGQGALELAFRQLHAKLESEGLFAPQRKKPIPRYPRNIVIITSRETAALQDMLKVLRRFPWLRICLYHASVQGDAAAEQIAAAIRHLHQTCGENQFELIMLARGGGSLEDLWAFNDEMLARAMAGCAIPIVSGIGHEVDRTIADLVADYHAHTPTEAAQIACAHWKRVEEHLGVAEARLLRAQVAATTNARQRLLHVERHEIFRRPLHRIDMLRQNLDDRQRSLVAALARRLRAQQARVERASSRLLECHPRFRLSLLRQQLGTSSQRIRRAMDRLAEHRALRLDSIRAQLEALAPQRVLERGFSITTHKKRGKPVRSASELKPGDRIVTRFAEGTAESTVEDANQPPLFE